MQISYSAINDKKIEIVTYLRKYMKYFNVIHTSLLKKTDLCQTYYWDFMLTGIKSGKIGYKKIKAPVKGFGEVI
jgi:hypothetical protein